jgi:hypothetical protein
MVDVLGLENPARILNSAARIASFRQSSNKGEKGILVMTPRTTPQGTKGLFREGEGR